MKIGDRFGRLVVTGEEFAHNRSRKVPVECECGTTKTVAVWNLLHGRTKSCGCYKEDRETERLLAALDRRIGYSDTDVALDMEAIW